MTKLTTLYNLLKQWQQEQRPDLVNPQAVEATKNIINAIKKEYTDRGGRRPV